MNPEIKFCLVIILTFGVTKNLAKTSCADSQIHFANLCFSPKPAVNLDVEWSQKGQPEDGWHMEIGNDISRLHYSEVLLGEHRSLDDDFENTCMTMKIEHGRDNGKHVSDGTVYGFGNLTSKWDCNASSDFPGVLYCDINSNLTIHHEYHHAYITYSDNKNLQILIVCYPNGQVGWTALTISKSLSTEERNTVNDQINTLGFSNNDTVVLYNSESCK